MTKTIVVSAVNLVEAGPLAVLHSCLRFLARSLAGTHEIVALVHPAAVLKLDGIRYETFGYPKRSWAGRVFFEYVHCRRLSRRLGPLLWLSLHDMTPNVTASRRAVYCHNASPFYRLPFSEALLDPRFALFNLFYRFLYAVNISRNDHVIVQQSWVRDRFRRAFGLSRIIVASFPVEVPPAGLTAVKAADSAAPDRGWRFFYPSLPRVFKNYEVLIGAARLLRSRGIDRFRIVLTMNGSENWYAARIRRLIGRDPCFELLGMLPREQVFAQYRRCHCLLFPSKLETWGIPISEAKSVGLPLLLADLPYAHESCGAYDRVAFFDPHDGGRLAGLMEGVIRGADVFGSSSPMQVQPPAARDWDELFGLLLDRRQEEISNA